MFGDSAKNVFVSDLSTKKLQYVENKETKSDIFFRESLLVLQSLRCGDDLLSSLDAVGQPDVAADDGIVSDTGISAQDGCAGIDDHVVPDVGMSLQTLDGVSVFIQRETLRTEGDALVQFDMMSDHSSLADYDACTMVDEKVTADGRAGMDVDSGKPVGVFRHHPRQERDFHLVKLMGETIDADRLERRIGQDDLTLACSCRISFVGRPDIGVQQFLLEN